MIEPGFYLIAQKSYVNWVRVHWSIPIKGAGIMSGGEEKEKISLFIFWYSLIYVLASTFNDLTSYVLPILFFCLIVFTI